MATTQDDRIADLQRAIAELRQERDNARVERDAALARHNTEFGERIEYQAATIDVLKAMSASPGDPQPVFELIVQRAQELCNSKAAGIYEYDGELVHVRSDYGARDIAGAATYFAAFPMKPIRGSFACRAILEKQVVHIRDFGAEPELPPIVRDLGIRSTLAIPLLRDGAAIGAFVINSIGTGGFSDSQVALSQTFAEQAVIAISSAETYRALQERTAALAARNSEYGERIEQQSATIDVLKVMSASPGDPQPVFDQIAERARSFCEAEFGAVTLVDGDHVCLHALAGTEAWVGQVRAAFPAPISPTSAQGRAIFTRSPVRIADTAADSQYTLRDVVTVMRSVAVVPMLRDGVAIGGIGIGRSVAGLFSDNQMELLQTFAEQAVIAITSAETFRALQTRTADLQESLEYQTATSDVLKAISRAAYDLQPVLDEVVATAARLCSAEMVAIARREGDLFPLAAHLGFPADIIANREMWGALDFGNTVSGRAAREGRIIHVHNVADEPNYPEELIRIGKQRSSLGVPLLRDDEVIGVMVLARQRVEPFTDRQIELIRTFADQAVIAIENTRLITEQREALEQQTATAEVLQVINASPGNLTPVFDAILEKAHKICNFDIGSLATYDGTFFRTAATRGYGDQAEAMARTPYRPLTAQRALLRGDRLIHVPDLQAYPVDPDDTTIPAFVAASGFCACLMVPLRKESTLLGFLTGYRKVAGPFSYKQITLLEGFAAQAVIAMENARLLTEQREALEQQTATAEVLQVINASPGSLMPVFEAMLEKAMRLCEAAFGALYTNDDGRLHIVATRGVPPAFANHRRNNPPAGRPGSRAARVFETKCSLHILDVMADQSYQNGDAHDRAAVDLGGARTLLLVPLLKEGAVLGIIAIYRKEVRAFSDKQIALLENFAAQAVIAMESARLLHELRARTEELAQRQAELRITFENMGDGVAMFDETQHLVAWNRKFQDILDVPDDIIERRQTFSEYVRYLAERDEYGREADPEEHVRRLIEQAGQSRTYERIRPDGRVIEIRHNPVSGGGFVLIYADITERKRNEAEIRAAKDAAEEASRTIEAAFRDLKAAQANLIQAEKMASLGQLTAGIAHEIKNPLNFVNNFAALSVDLLSELKETAAPGFAALTDDQRTEVEEVSAMLTGNLEKITEHGKRADGIVKAMLEHSRGSSTERRMVDLNVLIEEALNLAYHGARAQDQSFNITLERDFDTGIAPIEVNPQDMMRVFLNLFSNGFYAATRRARNSADAGFGPMLKVTTREVGEVVEIRVRDNGTGVPAEIRDKLFQPFFTTKPTGEGTGLGLSITYDIVTKQHGGTITVDSEGNVFTEFVVTLPCQMFANGGGRT